MFAFDASSFFANIPDGIGNITSEIIKLQAEGFAAKAVGQINGNIDYLFKQTCSTNHGTFAWKFYEHKNVTKRSKKFSDMD